jgi:glutathione S-transferase
VFESAAICLQLADLYPDAGLIPPLGSAEWALVYQWVLFGMTELEAPLFRWVREVAEDSTDSPSRERFAQGRKLLTASRMGPHGSGESAFGAALSLLAGAYIAARSKVIWRLCCRVLDPVGHTTEGFSCPRSKS